MKKIRTSKFSKVIASYLAIQLILTAVQPSNLFALTGGPSQPEFNSFTPIGTSDMVNLSSGDFNYNIPIMDVGGYPLNLAYDSGITMDQEASWVGLGWNLNVGQIARQVRGLPDDFKGDEMRYENDIRDNVTVGANFNIQPAFFGKNVPVSTGLGLAVQYNNYEGISFKPSYGVSYALNDNVRLGLNFSSSTTEGASVKPSVSLSAKNEDFDDLVVSEATGNYGVSFNSRKGLENMSISASGRQNEILNPMSSAKTGETIYDTGSYLANGSLGGYISFNDQSYTPYKRAGLINESFSFSGALGTEIMGPELQGQITGFGSYQGIRISEKDKMVPGFGYEHTEANEGLNGVLDFNREKDGLHSKNTNVLPITNYTYDIYSIQGQGAGGQFRPFRSQTSYVYDQTIIDVGSGGSFGVEAGVGNLVHTGFELTTSPSISYTGKWSKKNYALPKFVEKESDQNPIVYEPVYFQTIGELGLDPEPEIFNDRLYANKAIKIGLGGNSKYDRKALSQYSVKSINDGTNGTAGTTYYDSEPINSSIKRTVRKNRNQSIQKVTVAELENYSETLEELENSSEVDYATARINENAEKHHTAEIRTLKPDGSTYVFGETAYNIKKVEATFDMSGSNDINCATGIIGSVKSNGEPNSKATSDKFLNRITTPPYAHTYLLSSVLSSDYEDIDHNGPSDGDLGAYTLFNYITHDDNFKWRVPYESDEASYNEGLKSKDNDQKGNYIYGEKELVYIDKIETKTHVAYFKLIDREDGRGARGETQDDDTEEPGFQKAIDRIYLFSKPEFEEFRDQLEGHLDDDDPIFDVLLEKAIKVAHFDYNYSLCPNVPNNLNGGGKLTLERVYFTYRGSNMGRYTPYIFNYDNPNPDYNLKGYDVWGNYKENDTSVGCGVDDPITAAEFPYTDQDKTTADDNARAWTLTSINLPSGGELVIETEADDYQYVQNRKVMQMFNVTGAGNTDTPTDSQVIDATLYNGNDHKKYIYAKISDDIGLNITTDELIGDQIDEAIQFRMLLNMTGNSWQYDYVTGYFELDESLQNPINIFESSGATYVALPVKLLKKEGGFIYSDDDVNPITKAGWYFGRTYLNREIHSVFGKSTSTDFETIITELITEIPAVVKIFSGPNGELQSKGCAREFKPEKSWVRLLNPTKRKLGGGLRVTKIEMHDNWGVMTNNPDNPLYGQFYGQEYNYNNEDGNTSGVATFEPASSKENPFIEPIYDKTPEEADDDKPRDKLAAPRDSNYTEKPLGESFFPSPTVTYGRVEVKNLARKKTDENGNTINLKKHATGKVVNEFYTSYDFPTITDHTNIEGYPDNPGKLSQLLNISVRNHFTYSQGFVIETNDMNGKMKRQQVFAEGQANAISGVDYNYSMNEDFTLNNQLPTIDSEGNIDNTQTLGLHYDVVNDFRENYSKSETFGVSTNLAAFIAAIWPAIVVVPIPKYAMHENILRTAVTTKVIHKTGILKEKVAYDLGAEVSTQNLAWDASTGQVLLTKTVNEYDNAYYNFTYPSYWHYQGMGMASNNIGLEGYLVPAAGQDGSYRLRSLKSAAFLTGDLPFHPGDVLYTYYSEGSTNQDETLWVAEVNNDTIRLMDKDGNVINHECSPFVKGTLKFKIMRSGYKNMQMGSMASVTSMENPLDSAIDNKITNATVNSNVINASAVMYNDYWKPQDQFGLPRLTPPVLTEFDRSIDNDVNTTPSVDITNYGFNPYLYNVRGEWRAVESYAYLTGRKANTITGATIPNLKDDGFFSSFSPFYQLNNGNWDINANQWTSASTVTQYSPYGAELENKDALNRYSSAIYGYGYTLPTAVASNSKYQNIAFDGFEDYDYNNVLSNVKSAVVDENEEAFTRDHFSFKNLKNGTETNGEVTSEEAHTGTSSFKVTGDNVQITRGLEPYNYAIKDYDCSENDDQALNTVGVRLTNPGLVSHINPNHDQWSFRIDIEGEEDDANRVIYPYLELRVSYGGVGHQDNKSSDFSFTLNDGYAEQVDYIDLNTFQDRCGFAPYYGSDINICKHYEEGIQLDQNGFFILEGEFRFSNYGQFLGPVGPSSDNYAEYIMHVSLYDEFGRLIDRNDQDNGLDSYYYFLYVDAPF